MHKLYRYHSRKLLHWSTAPVNTPSNHESAMPHWLQALADCVAARDERGLKLRTVVVTADNQYVKCLHRDVELEAHYCP